MSENLYASVAELKDRLCLTGNDRDFAIDRYLQEASRWIDRTTGTRFYVNTTAEVRYYTASYCYWEVETDHIQSITELATDQNGDNVHETIWTVGTDYHLEPLNAVVNGEPYTKIAKTWWTGRFSFPSYPHSIKVTGTFGYCTLDNVPATIREVTLMIAEVNARPILDLSIPGVTRYRIGADMNIAMEEKTLPLQAMKMLDLYRRKAYVF